MTTTLVETIRDTMIEKIAAVMAGYLILGSATQYNQTAANGDRKIEIRVEDGTIEINIETVIT